MQAVNAGFFRSFQVCRSGVGQSTLHAAFRKSSAAMQMNSRNLIGADAPMEPLGTGFREAHRKIAFEGPLFARLAL